MSKSSWVWRYFTESPEQGYFLCNMCENKSKKKRVKNTCNNTTNLSSHLKNNHGLTEAK